MHDVFTIWRCAGCGEWSITELIPVHRIATWCGPVEAWKAFPAGLVVWEWAVEYGLADGPAGHGPVTEDRAAAAEDVQWRVGGRLVQRLVARTEWRPDNG